MIYSSGVVGNELGLLAKLKLRWDQLDRRKKRILIGALVIVVIILVLSVRGEGRRQVQPVVSPTPSPWAMVSTNTDDWEVYESDDGFSFKYPKEGNLSKAEDDSLVFLIAGPSQRVNTEFSDGVYVRFWVEKYGEKTLEGVARERYDYISKSATAELKSKLEKVKVAEKEGWVFTFESLGENKMYFLPIDGVRYLKVIDRSQDVSKVGLEEINRLLLGTLSL